MIELLVQMFILVWDRWLFGRQKIHPYLAVRIQTLSVTHTVASGYITNSGSVFSNEWRWRQWVRATNSIPSKKIAAQSALPIAKVTANKLEVVSHDLLSISRLGYIVCNFSYENATGTGNLLQLVKTCTYGRKQATTRKTCVTQKTCQAGISHGSANILDFQAISEVQEDTLSRKNMDLLDLDLLDLFC